MLINLTERKEAARLRFRKDDYMKHDLTLFITYLYLYSLCTLRRKEKKIVSCCPPLNQSSRSITRNAALLIATERMRGERGGGEG